MTRSSHWPSRSRASGHLGTWCRHNTTIYITRLANHLSLPEISHFPNKKSILYEFSGPGPGPASGDQTYPPPALPGRQDEDESCSLVSHRREAKQPHFPPHVPSLWWCGLPTHSVRYDTSPGNF